MSLFLLLDMFEFFIILLRIQYNIGIIKLDSITTFTIHSIFTSLTTESKMVQIELQTTKNKFNLGDLVGTNKKKIF